MAGTIPTTAVPTRRGRRPAPAHRRALLGLAAALALLPQLPACANAPHAEAHPVALSVVDRETGQPLTVYRKDGRSFVAGQPGTRYAIRLANRTAGRVLVVLSVDGVNVISGETAALGQTGYVLDPGRSFDIAGWRKSPREIAAFEFATLTDAYATRTGRPGNVGVIGMAAFLEKPAPRLSDDRIDSLPMNSSNNNEARQRAPAAKAAAPAAPAGSVMADAAGGGASSESRASSEATSGALAAPQRAGTERLGTAHGQRERSVSQTTRFERRSSTPQDLIEVAYDSHANLVLAGVIPQPAHEPRPFPGEHPQRGFVPDPPLR